jgi:hypothetical protein
LQLINRIFKDLEDINLKLAGDNSISVKYPEIFAEILVIFNNDEM